MIADHLVVRPRGIAIARCYRARMQDQIRELWASPPIRAAVIVVGSLVMAVIVERLIRVTLGALARRTSTTEMKIGRRTASTS